MSCLPSQAVPTSECRATDKLEAAGFSADVLSALRLLTHANEVPYEDYIQSLTVNRIAIEVKIADLEDNMDVRRLQDFDDKATAGRSLNERMTKSRL